MKTFTMNPYSTNRAYSSWQNGYDGVPATILDWLDCYRQGMVARKLDDIANEGKQP